jgi:hypothetical protein
MSTSTYDILNILCQIAQPTAASFEAQLWKGITFLWPWYWFLIVLVLGAWIAFEIVTRFGNAHYNSENGFSPMFNRFVGSGSYLLVHSLLLLGLSKIFGNGVYCGPTPYVLHALAFGLVGLTLHLSGFWPYLIEPGGRGRRKRRRC